MAQTCDMGRILANHIMSLDDNIIFETVLSLCHKHCGCASRKRRSLYGRSTVISPFGLLRIDDNESDDINDNHLQMIEFLALATIEVEEDNVPIRKRFKDSSKQISVPGSSPSRLRRSADFAILNQLYSSITERLDEIDVLFEGKFKNFIHMNKST